MCKHSDFLWLSMRSQRDQEWRTPTERSRNRIRFQSLSSNRFPSGQAVCCGSPLLRLSCKKQSYTRSLGFLFTLFFKQVSTKSNTFYILENLPLIEFKPFYPQYPPFAFICFIVVPKRGPCTSPSLSIYPLQVSLQIKYRKLTLLSQDPHLRGRYLSFWACLISLSIFSIPNFSFLSG